MAIIYLKGNPIRTNGELCAVGSIAPPFELVDHDLGSRSLKDFAGKRKLLSFVPSLDTAVCSLSSKKFNEKAQSLPNTVILVISADLPFAQKRWCGQENAKNIQTLSLMRSKECAKNYGVLIEEGPLAGLCARAILVLDEKNTVLYGELVSEITQEPNYEKALAALK